MFSNIKTGNSENFENKKPSGKKLDNFVIEVKMMRIHTFKPIKIVFFYFQKDLRIKK